MFGNTNKSFGKIRRIKLTRFAYPTKFVALEETAACQHQPPPTIVPRKVLGVIQVLPFDYSVLIQDLRKTTEERHYQLVKTALEKKPKPKKR
jgi:hypothetical protein